MNNITEIIIKTEEGKESSLKFTKGKLLKWSMHKGVNRRNNPNTGMVEAQPNGAKAYVFVEGSADFAQQIQDFIDTVIHTKG